MEKVYLIFKNYSDYDYTPGIIGFKTSKEEAENYVNKLNIEYKLLEDKYCDLRKREKEIAKNFVDPIHPTLKDWPRWASNIKITDEMRKERADIQAFNDELRSEYNKIVNENRKNRLSELKKTITPEENEIINKCIDFNETGFWFKHEFLHSHQPYYYESCKQI